MCEEVQFVLTWRREDTPVHAGPLHGSGHARDLLVHVPSVVLVAQPDVAFHLHGRRTDGKWSGGTAHVTSEKSTEFARRRTVEHKCTEPQTQCQ